MQLRALGLGFLQGGSGSASFQRVNSPDTRRTMRDLANRGIIPSCVVSGFAWSNLVGWFDAIAADIGIASRCSSRHGSPQMRSNAQTTTSGGLTGVVTDPSHAVVPGACVEVRDTAKGTVQSAKTDGDGVYRFFFLAPSRYTLTVMHSGFQEETRSVSVLLGSPGTLNISLKLAEDEH